MTFLLIQNSFAYPHENGFLTFTLGILFILSIYHFLLFFQQKDKVYLLYGSYTFFIILAHLTFIKDGFLNELLKPIEPIKNYSVVFVETYYIIYFFFTIRFLDVKSEFPKWTDYCYKAIYVLISLSVVLFISYSITNNGILVDIGYNYIFVPFMTLISIVVYVLFFKLKNKLKYYIIVGGLFLSICSYVSLAHYFVLIEMNADVQASYTILYIGFILENILFSLALGHKQKIILNERNESQKRLRAQLQENENLRLKVQKRFEKDVAGLSKLAEEEKLETFKMKYKKELAELKVTALRTQMNPHFIFNSLNSIKSYIIDNEKENAVYYLNKFSKLIRKILSASMEGNISLSEEVETAELYVNIENIRFNNEIDFVISMDKNLNKETIKIPSLILQPFLENAIWHGLSLKKGKKELRLNVNKEDNDFVKIEIIDNGVGRKQSREVKKRKLHKRESVGIKLTKERLKDFTNKMTNKFSLNIIDLLDHNNEPLGTQVTLHIPTS